MPGRLTPKTREIVYQFIADRDGELCNICRWTPDHLSVNCDACIDPSLARQRHTCRLEIDHISGDHDDWQPHNLRFLCKTCNVVEGNRSRNGGPSDPREREREIRGVAHWARARKHRTGHGSEGASAQMRANDQYEPKFREWLTEQLFKKTHITKADAIGGGAFVTGANTQTITRYLVPLVSFEGPFEIVNDLVGAEVIRVREPSEGPQRPETPGEPVAPRNGRPRAPGPTENGRGLLGSNDQWREGPKA